MLVFYRRKNKYVRNMLLVYIDRQYAGSDIRKGD